MENKKEKRKVSTKTLIAALLVLVLLLASVLGFTLARYFTQGEESQGGINIAQWDIDVTDSTTDEGAGTVTAMLSPNMREYTGTVRKRTVTEDGATALVITNNSDVKAEVTLTITGGLVFYGNTLNDQGEYPEVDNTPTINEWQNVDLNNIISFATEGEGSGISVTYGTGTDAGSTVEGEAGTGDNLGKTIYTATLEANGGWMKVSLGQITWTSDFDGTGTGSIDDGDANMGNYGDLRDTWIGENVGSVGFAYTWEAAQASELPDGGSSTPNT